MDTLRKLRKVSMQRCTKVLGRQMVNSIYVYGKRLWNWLQVSRRISMKTKYRQNKSLEKTFSLCFGVWPWTTEQRKLPNNRKMQCERSALYLTDLHMKNLSSYKCTVLSFKEGKSSQSCDSWSFSPLSFLFV